MVGDFVLQTNEEAQGKFDDAALRMKHVQKYGNAFVPFLLWRWYKGDTTFARAFFGLWALNLAHYITDSRRWASGEEWPPKPILVDQAIHLVQLALLQEFLER